VCLIQLIVMDMMDGNDPKRYDFVDYLVDHPVSSQTSFQTMQDKPPQSLVLKRMK
jgi:hypothetical protein